PAELAPLFVGSDAQLYLRLAQGVIRDVGGPPPLLHLCRLLPSVFEQVCQELFGVHPLARFAAVFTVGMFKYPLRCQVGFPYPLEWAFVGVGVERDAIAKGDAFTR